MKSSVAVRALVAAEIGFVSCLPASGEDVTAYRTPRFDAVSTNAAVKFADVVDYKGKPQELLVDIYRPEGDSATNRPVAVLIHGGGFRTSGKRTQKYIVHFANELARRGFVAASIDYRQRKGEDMPTAADDLPAMKDATADSLTALQWIRAHGKEYGYDPAKIFLVGGSAGGRITCAIACRENGDTGGLPVSDKFSSTEPPSSVASEKSADYSRAGLIAAAVLWGGPEPEYRCFTIDG
ncbi:MAG: alpha/beta hydrolase, partial [Sphaerospermopsis kisseleviana]